MWAYFPANSRENKFPKYDQQNYVNRQDQHTKNKREWGEKKQALTHAEMKWFHPQTQSTIELCLGALERSSAYSGEPVCTARAHQSCTEVRTSGGFLPQIPCETSNLTKKQTAKQDESSTVQFIRNSFPMSQCSSALLWKHPFQTASHWKALQQNRFFKAIWQNTNAACFMVIMFTRLKPEGVSFITYS